MAETLHDRPLNTIDDRFTARINALVADDREDLIAGVVAEYATLAAERTDPVGRVA
jgi:hypothetical protein